MSYNGIGLKSARGSGTNGYVQRNLSNIKEKYDTDGAQNKQYQRRKQLKSYSDKKYDKNDKLIRSSNSLKLELYDHQMKRELELKVMEYRDKLEDEFEEEGSDDTEDTDLIIEKLVKEYREKLIKDMNNRSVRDKKYEAYKNMNEKEKKLQGFKEQINRRQKQQTNTDDEEEDSGEEGEDSEIQQKEVETTETRSKDGLLSKALDYTSLAKDNTAPAATEETRTETEATEVETQGGTKANRKVQNKNSNKRKVVSEVVQDRNDGGKRPKFDASMY
ncbi:hypothetical protein BVG19_g1271 [[Candida] boidinii]|nr:hypothetical protein BVG19_g1271 [[Candida] boidinii]OWB52523.1 hypothetical protein B5S27_g4100 [[Candida] boidinii]OWB84306.1 hypothetical protein B5S33_g2949 [[Candida] boidinii]